MCVITLRQTSTPLDNTLCKERNRTLTYDSFRADIKAQLRAEKLHQEGRRIYTARTWRYEESTAKDLSELLKAPHFPTPALPERLIVGEITLCSEQRDAVICLISCGFNISTTQKEWRFEKLRNFVHILTP